MISVKELNDLITRKKTLIDTFDPAKLQQVYDLKGEILKLLNRYNKLEKEIDDDKSPLADLSAALTNLSNLEKQIAFKEKELKDILSENEPLQLKRDPSDAGTVGGNGTVVFRATGKKFFLSPGTLTQKEIEDKKKAGSIKSLRSKP